MSRAILWNSLPPNLKLIQDIDPFKKKYTDYLMSKQNNEWLYSLYQGLYSVAHVRNSEIKQLRPLFFAMLWDIDLIFGIWVYNDKLQIKFTFRSSPMIFGRVMALDSPDKDSVCSKRGTTEILWNCLLA
jgi:hypothetical protein